MAFLRPLLIAALAFVAFGQNLPLPPLPYEYNALEPYIDEATMRTHHLKHHQAYTDKANAALAALREDPKHKHLAKLGIDTLLTRLADVPEPHRVTLRNHGGGYVNHDLFWKIMSPHGGPSTLVKGALHDALHDEFGGYDKFVSEFSKQAAGLFGSGWVWLYLDSNQDPPRLKITTTPNQDTPAMTVGHTPILCLDVWEHAYYLNYQNRRPDYISSWWYVVNWAEVESLYEKAVESCCKPRQKVEL
eukprot:comp19294_c1_seq1/m.22137 comp19294_c1_seq1/g.22137  ORF comp19294_c1_seq1/g.22137 comp19294_c1_seq1/m.22137 type:complete len:246 (-) comp19294_c1_seq1:189-926(-)